jgi:hypothetical protein
MRIVCPDCGEALMNVQRCCAICGGSSWMPKGQALPFADALKRRREAMDRDVADPIEEEKQRRAAM